MQWKIELFEANTKISEKDLLDKLGLEISESNRDAQLSKEIRWKSPSAKKILQEVPSMLAAFRVGLVERWVRHG
jgi:hypothetical protein